MNFQEKKDLLGKLLERCEWMCRDGFKDAPAARSILSQAIDSPEHETWGRDLKKALIEWELGTRGPITPALPDEMAPDMEMYDDFRQASWCIAVDDWEKLATFFDDDI